MLIAEEVVASALLTKSAQETAIAARAFVTANTAAAFKICSLCSPQLFPKTYQQTPRGKIAQ